MKMFEKLEIKVKRFSNLLGAYLPLRQRREYAA